MKSLSPQRQRPAETEIKRLSLVSIGGNAALAAGKLAAGIFGHSSTMVMDAVHSLSDLISTMIAWIGARMAARPADAGHPYGHERLECAAALLLCAVLAAAGLGLGWTPLETLLSPEPAAPPAPVALWAAAASIVVKEWMFWYTKKGAARVRSQAFLADAWHHRSDALSSVGALIGIAGGMMGRPWLDSIAGLAICGFVLKAAWDIGRDALLRMVDASCGAAFEADLKQLVSGSQGVERIDALRTRLFASRVCVELEIGVAAASSFVRAHAIAVQVERSVEQAFPEVKHVTVHVNPVASSAAGPQTVF